MLSETEAGRSLPSAVQELANLDRSGCLLAGGALNISRAFNLASNDLSDLGRRLVDLMELGEISQKELEALADVFREYASTLKDT